LGTQRIAFITTMDERDKILLIEDDRIDVMTIQRGLKKNKLDDKLLVYYSAINALAFLHSADKELLPKLILLDLNMPKMDGLDFLRIIKKYEVLCKIPVIVVTTSQSEKDKAACFELQVAGFFKKPVDYFDLIDSIAGYWDNSEVAPL
jgi:CheY-like chemotaxis protein